MNQFFVSLQDLLTVGAGTAVFFACFTVVSLIMLGLFMPSIWLTKKIGHSSIGSSKTILSIFITICNYFLIGVLFPVLMLFLNAESVVRTVFTAMWLMLLLGIPVLIYVLFKNINTIKSSK